MNKPLRIGVMLDSLSIATWQHAILERLIRADFANIELLVIDGRRAAAPQPFLKRLWTNRGKIAYSLFNKVDERLFRPNPDPFAPRDCTQLLADVPRLTITPVEKKFSDYFVDDDVARIRTHDIDVFLRMGFRILKGESLKCARYGVWSFHHGDNLVNRGAPPGFWEAMQDWGQTGSILQVLTEELDGGLVIHRSWSMTDRLGLARGRAQMYWKTLSFVPRKLEELHRLGAPAFFNRLAAQHQDLLLYSGPLYRVPTNLPAAWLATKRLTKVLGRGLTRLLFNEQWFLLFQPAERPATTLWRFKPLVPPRDRFWADPFIICRDGTFHIFFEELFFEAGKGHISALSVDANGVASAAVKVLERPYHLSYPFLLEHEGRLFMVPETRDNRTIELYECTQFPSRWEHRANLMENVAAADATLLRHDGKWWLFCTMIENDGASLSDELFLFFADDLFTTHWTPHPNNPIVSDVRRARPAGRIFEHDGVLFRPSQNCSHRYGHGVNINKIVKLSPTDYEEVLHSAVTPRWDRRIVGMHTYNFCAGMTVIDAVQQRNRFFG